MKREVRKNTDDIFWLLGRIPTILWKREWIEDRNIRIL